MDQRTVAALEDERVQIIVTCGPIYIQIGQSFIYIIWKMSIFEIWEEETVNEPVDRRGTLENRV